MTSTTSLFPPRDLPHPPSHANSEAYLSALLTFVTESPYLQTFCGGVHILDFLTQEPDLATRVLEPSWRAWFASVDNMMDIVHLLTREDVDDLLAMSARSEDAESVEKQRPEGKDKESKSSSWRGYALPPRGLLEYISTIRNLLLNRSFEPVGGVSPPELSRIISVGMSAKKAHEVRHFASFVDGLASGISESAGGKHQISHLVDFGSGQNYLGRVLAGSDYERNIVALESKLGNIQGARRMDVHAKMKKKEVVFRNKKEYLATMPSDLEGKKAWMKAAKLRCKEAGGGRENGRSEGKVSASESLVTNAVERRIHYMEHVITDGRLDDVADHTRKLMKEQNEATNGDTISNDKSRHIEPELMVISLHSCGNLLHHGLRSLILNPSVKAVAMIGCCYNLCTERLGPPTYKIPALRTPNRRLEETTMAFDPHGFPISERFATYKHPKGTGVRFNITARMMAVQAPQNWTQQECDSFFLRHFYRALLQRLFLDTGFIDPPMAPKEVLRGDMWTETRGEPIIIGTLPKSCYKSFLTYARAAMAKVSKEPTKGESLLECTRHLSDEDIASYEERYRHKFPDLCVLWSLMALTACVVECAIVTDRWQYLKEQPDVEYAWVQTVFEYSQSPRNLAIVGIKR